MAALISLSLARDPARAAVRSRHPVAASPFGPRLQLLETMALTGCACRAQHWHNRHTTEPLFRRLPGGTEENREDLGRDSRCSGQVFEPGTSRSRSRLTATRPRHLVHFLFVHGFGPVISLWWGDQIFVFITNNTGSGAHAAYCPI
jgi:hypothetical protein